MNNLYLCNVVFYDGVEAYVSKFILQGDDNYTISKNSDKKVREYLEGNGEVLKIDINYKICFDEFLAFCNNDTKLKERFESMFC